MRGCLNSYEFDLDEYSNLESVGEEIAIDLKQVKDEFVKKFVEFENAEWHVSVHQTD